MKAMEAMKASKPKEKARPRSRLQAAIQARSRIQASKPKEKAKPTAMQAMKAMKAMKASKPTEKAMKAMKAMKAGKKTMKAEKAMKAMKAAMNGESNEGNKNELILFDKVYPSTTQQTELLRRVGVALSKVKELRNIAIGPQDVRDSLILVGALLDSGVTISMDRYSFCS